MKGRVATIRRLGVVSLLCGFAFAANASPSACVSGAPEMGAQELVTQTTLLQIETRKRGRSERWTTDPCDPSDLRLHMLDAQSGIVYFPSGATSAIHAEDGAAWAFAAQVVGALASAEAFQPAMVPLLGADAIGVGSRPAGKRSRWSAGVGLEVLNQTNRTFAGPLVTARRELGREWLEFVGDVGLGGVLREEVQDPLPLPDSLRLMTAHFVGGAQIGPSFGPIGIRGGAAMGVRWQPVEDVDVVGLFAELETSSKTVAQLEQEYAYLTQVAIPLLALTAEVSIDAAPRVRGKLSGGLESYLQLNESIDATTTARVVHGTGPTNGFVSQVAMEVRL